MDPRKKPDPRKPDPQPQDDVTGKEAPGLEEQDWDAIESGSESGGESGAITPDSLPENGDFRYEPEDDGELPEEEDDNAYQNSDEALPDDREERAIARDPSREGGRFDEI